MEIGSTYWRLINYGLIATLKYSYQKIFKKKIIHSFDLSKIEDLEIYLYKKEYTKIATSDLINLTKKIQDDLRKYFFNNKECNKAVKKVNEIYNFICLLTSFVTFDYFEIELIKGFIYFIDFKF